MSTRTGRPRPVSHVPTSARSDSARGFSPARRTPRCARRWPSPSLRGCAHVPSPAPACLGARRHCPRLAAAPAYPPPPTARNTRSGRGPWQRSLAVPPQSVTIPPRLWDQPPCSCAPAARNTPAPWGRGRPWPQSSPPIAATSRSPPKPTDAVGPAGSTTPHLHSPTPSPDAAVPVGSAGPAPFFSGVLRVRAGNPLLGSLPAPSQAHQRCSNGLTTHPFGGQSLLQAYLCRQVQRPHAGRLAILPRALVQDAPQFLGLVSGKSGMDGMGTGRPCLE